VHEARTVREQTTNKQIKPFNAPGLSRGFLQFRGSAGESEPYINTASGQGQVGLERLQVAGSLSDYPARSKPVPLLKLGFTLYRSHSSSCFN
jgi:hypothetical protein